MGRYFSPLCVRISVFTHVRRPLTTTHYSHTLTTETTHPGTHSTFRRDALQRRRVILPQQSHTLSNVSGSVKVPDSVQ